ncbi:unnamed protein product [Effrenium voratum]|nr:unnamed protein product [Effrenium voratum]
MAARFKRRLNDKVWQTLDLDAAKESKASKDEGQRARAAAAELLRKALAACGEDAAVAAQRLEAALFAEHGKARRYQAEVRRLCTALREAENAKWLQELPRRPEAAAELVRAAPEELLPSAKMARLQELRKAPPEESGTALTRFTEVDERLHCVECGKSGVRFQRLATSREGFNKAETWGSGEDKGERCRGHCPHCLAEWNFEL